MSRGARIALIAAIVIAAVVLGQLAYRGGMFVGSH